ncbi:MAG: NifB/NifX family molybdenum-iron cluster-binding protein [Deltaproteobacteria bacterium]|nr:NifB/NifX family molybdenum-iron cluster-binding protein [Deltaproteobacteria bacterium]
MKIAIPEYEGRVSPVFDACQKVLVFETDGGGVATAVGSEDWSYLPPAVRANRLREAGIEVLLCGGISGWLARLVEAMGIRLIPWLAGDVDQVVDAFIAGRLPQRSFAMPGSWGKGWGWRFRRRGMPRKRR